MPGRDDRLESCYWRLDFIQWAAPGDDRCVMLYGQEGEVIGPMSMRLAEAWLDHFDDRRLAVEIVRQAVGARRAS